MLAGAFANRHQGLMGEISTQLSAAFSGFLPFFTSI
jgi:hypothetical protein